MKLSIQHIRILCASIMASILIVSSTAAAGSFSVSGGVGRYSGKYIYQTTAATYAFNTGLRYQEEQFSFSLSLPFLLQNSDAVSRSGGVLLPHGKSGSSQTSGGMMNGASSSFMPGLGDIFVTGNYRIADESNSLPSVSITGQIKMPTARTDLGTGQWDFGGSLSAKKQFGTFGVFADAGYLLLGNPPGAQYRNPFTFGAGVGKLFMNGELSTMLYYQAYTRVLDGYAAPQQISLGVLYQISPVITFSLIGSLGLSSTVPAQGILVGIEITL